MPKKTDLASRLISLMGESGPRPFSRKFDIALSTLANWKHGRVGPGAGFLLQTLVASLEENSKTKRLKVAEKMRIE